jgi:hypothetical protein
VVDSNDWNFEGAFSAAAGVIPVLLLALVLEKELLPVAAEFAAELVAAFEKPPSRLMKLLKWVNPGISSVQLSAEMLRPSRLIGLAVIAELLALFGVAEPGVWRTENPVMRTIALASLVFIAFTIFQLLMSLWRGLRGLAEEAEEARARAMREQETGEDPPS